MYRIHRGTLTLQTTAFSALRLVLASLCCWSALLTVTALSQTMHARITRVSNTVTLQRGAGGNLSLTILKVGDLLKLGDIIDTGNGSVVIAMDDGSQVIVYPNSRVNLKDFSNAVTWRDLLDVVVGRIRVKISHAKRPNPYRVYSPIATIAVRGTDFLVIVEANRETRVYVFDGLVEVSSMINPQKSVLVKPGKNIVVKPDGNISMVMTAPRGELNEIRSLRAGLGPETSLRNGYNIEQRSSPGLLSSRYTAFDDSHIDSLQNPAYATGFRQPSGRFYLIPSFNPKVETTSFGGGLLGSFDSYSATSHNYTLSSQATYFTPLGSKFVIGGGAAATRTDFGSASTERLYNLTDQISDTNHFDGSVLFTTASLSLIAARRFGQAERTSFGIKVDYLEDHSSYSFHSDKEGQFQPVYHGGDTRAHRSDLTIGFTQNFGDDKKLGIYYRYGKGTVPKSAIQSEYWGKYFIDNSVTGEFYEVITYRPAYEQKITRQGHGSDAGVLFRGSLTRRLFYGMESSINFEEDQFDTYSPGGVRINNGPPGTRHYLEKRRANGGMIGAGIGYALRQRTVLSMDFSVGRVRQDSQGQNSYSDTPEDVSFQLDPYFNQKSTFRALHIGGQTDLWKNIFAGGSLSFIREKIQSLRGDYVTELQSRYFREEGSTYDYQKYNLTSIYAGWRIRHAWVVQYTYSTSYGNNAPGHSLMLRWEFGGNRRQQSQ
jgi:FecR-like protein